MKEKASNKTDRNANESPVPERLVPKGIIVAIGGKENKGLTEQENKRSPNNFTGLDILRRFVELIEKDDPIIEVITSASSLAEESFDDYKKVFTDLGIKKIGHIHHKTRKDLLADDLLDRINAADAFFFSGGDQLLLTSIYGGSIFLTRMKERYIRERVVIGGTSAGAMALSTPMIYAGSNEVQQLAGEIKVTLGLEFLKDVCIDTHFVHRGRFIRLAQVIATNPTCIGIGIEEDTAIIVCNGKEAEVIGSGTIVIFEGYDITFTNADEFGTNKLITIKDLVVHILSQGDSYVINNRNPPHN